DAARSKAVLVRNDLKKRLPMLTAMANAAVARAQAAYELAEYNWKRIQELQASGSSAGQEAQLTKSNYEDAKGALDSARLNLDQAKLDETMRADQAEQDVKLAEAALHQADATLFLAKEKRKRAEIKAPIDGFVLKRLVNVGEPVISALTAQYVFIITPDLSKMQLQANVSESDIAMVQKGQQVTFTV